ncbi:MAG: DUF3137 domain-containing protein [Gemmatimonadota bacterium]
MNVAQYAQLDAPTRARIESACSFVNHKVQHLRRRVTVMAAAAVAIAVVWWLIFRPDPRLPGFFAVGVILFVTGRAQREVKKWYKTLVIRRVVDALGHGLTYSQVSSLTKSQFKDMDFFTDRVDVWKSEDQVAGKRREVDFALHEVRAARREKRGKTTHEVVFFQGLIVALEFNKNFHGHTIVVPDKGGRLLGSVFGESETRRNKQIVRLANADFENMYTAYSTDDQEAHYLLTPKLMELVMQARLRMGADLRLAFFQNSLFVTVPSRHDRFEVALFGNRNVTPLSVIGDLADVVALAENLIDVLDLETRIWTRV